MITRFHFLIVYKIEIPQFRNFYCERVVLEKFRCLIIMEYPQQLENFTVCIKIPVVQILLAG